MHLRGAWNLILQDGLARRMDRQDAKRLGKPANGRWLRLIAFLITSGGAILVLTATLAHAEDGGSKGGSEFLLLVQVALLIGVGRGLGEVMQR